MTLTLEVDTDFIQALQARATARGESTEAYAEALLREQLASAERVDGAIRRLSSPANTFSRDGMSWKELAHEGHKY
jgi:hypothetical protein